MAERLHPGVYVEEVSSGIRPIEAVGTSTAAFVGEAARGRPGHAHFLASFADYVKALGGHLPDDKGLLAQAVQTFFLAGGRRAYAVRVLPAGATRGTSAQVATRLPAGEGWPNAAWFRALGDGAWADALRIDIGASTHFPGEAFRIDVKWVEGGASRTVETFDDVRMDPKSEDYFADVIKRTSAYVEAHDAYQQDITSAAPASPPLPETSAALRPAPLAPGVTSYRVYRGVELTFQWIDTIGGGNVISSVVSFDDAQLDQASPGKKFVDGAADVTPKELGLLIKNQLGASFRVVPDPTLGSTGASDIPEVQAGTATRPYLLIRPTAGATFDLTGRTLTLTIGGADEVIDPPAAGADAVTPQGLADRITAKIPAGAAAFPRGNVVVVRGAPSATDAPIALVETLDAGVVGNTLSSTASGGQGGQLVDHPEGVVLSVTETRPATAKSVLASIGLPARSHGYDEGSATNPALRPLAQTGLRLSGGTDGPRNAALGVTDFTGDPSRRTGLHALDGIDINLVAIPGKNTPGFISAGMAYCDRRGDCFFIGDGPGSTSRDFEMDASEAKLFVDGLPQRSKNSALYFPWIEVADPVGVGKNPTRYIPPSGYIAGIFARTDIGRGVWKAPAGIEAALGGSLDLQVKVRDTDQDLLNPVGLNCVRQLAGAGIVTWGARTLASDAEWRYVPVRRTALFLKESLRRGLLWAVFEPNDVPLWDQIRTNITSFMLGLFRQGAFQGSRPEDAFEVRCDRSTNPQELVDAGIVTAKVSFAPLKPAEFVVIEISQKSLVS